MRIICLLLLGTFLATPGFAQGNSVAGQEEPLPLPTEWETYYVMLIRPGPVVEWQNEALQELMNDHIQYQLRLQADGRAIAAGGVAPDSTAAAPLVGFTLLRASSLEEAKLWAEADPAVAAGRFSAEVRTWYVPAGRLSRRD
ncbi:MAG: hypothetical protein HKN13_02380 [Rhodothermales bacterium]|nr:hypothetical protein [Rhodothermales bacterium]